MRNHRAHQATSCATKLQRVHPYYYLSFYFENNVLCCKQQLSGGHTVQLYSCAFCCMRCCFRCLWSSLGVQNKDYGACFADVTNRGWRWGGGGGNYVCFVGYVACNVVHDVVCDVASCISISINPEITIY